jgi:hypothetical protein
VDAIAVDDIAAVPVELHEYQPMRRGQRATAASDHDQMPAPINVAGQVEIICDGDLLAASLAQRHSSRPLPSSDSFMANFPGYHLPSGKAPMAPSDHLTRLAARSSLLIGPGWRDVGLISEGTWIGEWRSSALR